jgi:two-component system OmpR family response regulator/two-component system copper resistance phosphate regulon response regulator CusR
LPFGEASTVQIQTFKEITSVRVLVVEDEARTAEYLQKGLTESGFVVDIATTGGDGIHMSEMTNYDVIILDVMLPGADGWTVIKAIRAKGDTPVLFLTALDDVADRVKGFEMGADDYLVKPFAFAELLARIRRCLRQSTAKESERLRIADLEIDVLGRRVYRGSERIELTNQEFTLLHLLMRRRGEVLSRTTIASQVWDVNFDTDTNVVDVAIRRLRAKVDDPFDEKLIHTVRGMGYVLDPDRKR